VLRNVRMDAGDTRNGRRAAQFCWGVIDDWEAIPRTAICFGLVAVVGSETEYVLVIESTCSSCFIEASNLGCFSHGSIWHRGVQLTL
jgi:hypothetical protein